MKIYPNFLQALCYVILSFIIGVIYFSLLDFSSVYFNKSVYSSLHIIASLFYLFPIIVLLKFKSNVDIKIQFFKPQFKEFFITMIVVIILYYIFKFFDLNLKTSRKNIEISYMISIIFLVPFFEELFLRGIILKQFLKKYDFMTAIILTSLLSSITLFDYKIFISNIIFYTFLNIVYFKFRESLIIAILFHCTWNMLSVWSI